MCCLYSPDQAKQREQGKVMEALIPVFLSNSNETNQWKLQTAHRLELHTPGQNATTVTKGKCHAMQLMSQQLGPQGPNWCHSYWLATLEPQPLLLPSNHEYQRCKDSTALNVPHAHLMENFKNKVSKTIFIKTKSLI